MSLKAFHLFFVAASIVCAFVFAAWCAEEYQVRADPGKILLGGLSFVAGVGLFVYGIKVRKKLRSLKGL